MNIINKVGQWQAIPMAIIKDESLSYAAKGLYARLAILPEESEITVTSVKCDNNRRTIAKLFIELRDAGWLEVLHERADKRKIYQLNCEKRTDGACAKNAHATTSSECKKCTRACAKNAHDSRARNNIYNINNNILDISLETRAREVPTIYHYPFMPGMTFREKLRCLIDGVNGFVERKTISEDQARRFVEFWSEPMSDDQNKLRMEGQDAWSLEVRIKRWIDKSERL